MAITLYTPWKTTWSTLRLLPTLWERDFLEEPKLEELWGGGEPKVDITETKKHYMITAEFPGFKKEEVKVEINDGVLSLAAERNKEEKKEEEAGFTRYERYYGVYHRSFRLPEEVDAEKIKAEMKDGVLTLTLPKTKKAEAKTQTIEIH